SGSPSLGQIAAFSISPAVARLMSLAETVCMNCREPKWLSLSTPTGFVCFACRVARQPKPTRRADIHCRGCKQTPAETGDDLSRSAVAFTCVDCLMKGAVARPICRRCLGTHWDAPCGSATAEAKAVRSGAEPTMRPAAMPRCLLDGRHPAGSPWACRVTVYSGGAAGELHPAPAPVTLAESKIGEGADAESSTS